jgi:hypothetical protein
MVYRPIDPGRFSDKPLMLRRMAEDDHLVIIDEMTAGRIFRTARSERTVWFWTITGPYLNAPDLQVSGSGEVASLDEAGKSFSL